MSFPKVILKSGKTHPSLYKTIPNAIKNVGIGNIKEIKEVRSELVEAKYEEPTGTLNIE
jgi:hypothetical protein